MTPGEGPKDAQRALRPIRSSVMRSTARIIAAAFALAATSVTAVSAQPAGRCSHDAFPVAGQTIGVTVCAGAPQGKSVQVTETLKGRSGSFSHTTSVDVLPGTATSRAVDDVGLTPLGLTYTLHLTLAYREGSVAIEHALLLPGAVPLK